MHFSQKNKIANGRSLDIRTTPTDARISNDYRGQNGNTDVSNMYMLEKGADSAPTNFNKRDISTSHEQRVAYSRGKVTIAEQERHAITAKLNKRGWLGKHP